MDICEGTLCFPLSLYHFPARSLILCGYLLWSEFHCFFLSVSVSLSSSFPPSAGVCALDREDVLACLQRLQHKNGSGNSGSTLLRVPPPHMAVNATNQPPDLPTAVGKRW